MLDRVERMQSVFLEMAYRSEGARDAVLVKSEAPVRSAEIRPPATVDLAMT